MPIFVPVSGSGARSRRVDPLGAYRVAVAELPRSAGLATHPTSAVVVLDARGSERWVAGVEDALAAGALGVIVDGIDGVDAGLGLGSWGVGDVTRMAGSDCPAGSSTAGGAPVLVARRFLPSSLRDAVFASEAELGDGARLVMVEAGGALETGVLRDALGWARVLADAPLTLVSARPGVHGAAALAESEQGVPVPISWTRSVEPAWLRVSAFGAVEVQVDIDDGSGIASVTGRSADGERVVRGGFEGRARRQLRRAIDAVHASAWPEDLPGLLQDLRLQRCIVGPRGG